MGPSSKPLSSSSQKKDKKKGGATQLQARRSNMEIPVAGDGIVWKERLAVVEGVTPQGDPRLYIRSYFRHPGTHERVWDEPPSGASGVDFATPELRKHAETQMKELQFTLDLIPPDPSKQSPPQQQQKKSVFGMFKKKEKSTLKDDSKDLNLQRAIARSMADQHGGGSSVGAKDDPRILYDSEFSDARGSVAASTSQSSAGSSNFQQLEDEDLAMAKALSLSENSAIDSSHQTNGMTEEEMLKLAIEQSRKEAYGVIPSKAESPLRQHVSETKACVSPASSEKIVAFDPYSPQYAESVSTSRSTTPTNADAEEPSIHKIEESSDHDTDRKHPARSLSRKMFGTRKRMEAQAGVI